MKIDEKNYIQWLSEIKRDYLGTKLSAALKINEELLRFYYRMGQSIVIKGYEAKYGSGFFKKLSEDIKKEIPNSKGFSPTNLHYMSAFYRRYTSLFEKFQQPAEKLSAKRSSIVLEKISRLLKSYLPFLGGHHQLILGIALTEEESFILP